jgi:hypothetical protein
MPNYHTVSATQVALPTQTWAVAGEANDRAQMDGQGRMLRGAGTLVPTPQPAKFLFWGSLTLTDMLLADAFAANSAVNIQNADLHGMTQARLCGRVSVVGAAAAKLQLRFRAGAFSTTVADYLIAGTTSVEIPLNALGAIDSGWIDLVTAAKIDGVFLGLMAIGGDGALDPIVSHIRAEFR